MMDYRQNPHVEIIRQCAAAVAAGMEPVVVQSSWNNDKWIDHPADSNGMPDVRFNGGMCMRYRIKPRTVTVHGVELPEPLRVAPKVGEKYWDCDIEMEDVCDYVWNGDEHEKRWLAHGMLHSTREAAEQWREFLLSMTRSKE